MEPNILMRIIHEGLFLELAQILMVYFLINFVNLKLSFRILGVRIETRKIILGTLVVVIYNTCAKQIISFLPAYGLILIVLLATCIKLIGGKTVSLIKSCWAALLVVLITITGVLLIQSPLMLNPKIAQFIIKTPIGVAVGSICELIFPLFLLFLLRTFDISIIPPVKRKVTLIDTANLYLFAGIFSLLYIAFEQTLKNVVDGLGILKNMLYQLFIASTLLAVFYFVYTNTRKRHDIILEENQRLTAEKNKLLNKLQSKSKTNITNEQLMPHLNDFIDSIAPVIVELYGKKPKINPNLAALAQFGLDERDGEIIGWLVLGKTYAQIAEEVHLAHGTVANKVSGILKKLDLKDREELARFALENNLVEITN